MSFESSDIMPLVQRQLRQKTECIYCLHLSLYIFFTLVVLLNFRELGCCELFKKIDKMQHEIIVICDLHVGYV